MAQTIPNYWLTPARTNGSSPLQYAARAWQVHDGRTTDQRYGFTMPSGRAVTMVLVLIRHNLSQQMVAALHGISQPTVSRIYRYLLPILGESRAWTAATPPTPSRAGSC